MAEAAKEYGAKIYENCDVKKVMVGEGKSKLMTENHSFLGRKVYAVDTDEGIIDTNTFVNTAGAVGQNLKSFKIYF